MVEPAMAVGSSPTPRLGDASRVICTLGMHRSATSLTARMLNLLGVHLGPDDVTSGTGADNPRGYWEHHRLAQINDEILAKLGGSWDQPPTFPLGWPRDSRMTDLSARARQRLTEDFGAAPLWGWKDPRTCLTLPFWRDLIGPMRYVICVRNPGEVAASLTCRNGMSCEKAVALWLTHVQASLAHTSGQPRMFIFFEDILEDAPRELRRLAAFIGHPERAEDPSVRDALEVFLERELCHHRVSLEAVTGDRRISFPIQALYLSLRLHLSPPGADRSGRGLNRALDMLGARALEAWERTAALAAERERSLQSTARLEADLEATALERDRLVRDHDLLVHALGEIHQSRAWRIVKRVRGLIAGILPKGTLRRRGFDFLLGRIVRRRTTSAQAELVDRRAA